MKNQVVSMHIPNGPDGYKHLKIAGWDGQCFIVPRTELKEIEKRKEIYEPGIYFLFGESDETAKPILYIGESERFFERLRSHDANKDSWNKAIIFTGGLDKAKIKYLEFKSTSEARRVGRYDLMNTVSPKENSLSEFDLIATDSYFEKINYVLAVMGYPVFQDISKSLADPTIYYIKADNADAKAQLLSDGSMNVLSGSLARIRETNSFHGTALTAREKYKTDGTLKIFDDAHFIFTKDILFTSPSTAASVIKGRSTNGWTSWKDIEGHTMDENLRN